MKLLYIIPSFQHPDVRGPTRHYHFVRELAKRHSITLLVLNRGQVGAGALAEMRSYVDELQVVNLTDGGPTLMGGLAGRIPMVGQTLQSELRLRHTVRQMSAMLRQLRDAAEFDLIVFHGKSVFPVIRQLDDLPVVIDFCDATSMRIRNRMRYASFFKRPLLWLRSAEMRRIEQGILDKTPHVAFISPRDRQAVLGSASQAAILPNGVDHEFWRRKSAPAQRNCLAFTGVMDYAPNHDAAMHLLDRIAPRIRQSIPDLEILIVGRSPHEALRQRAASDPRVTVTGFVDDVRPYLERAALFVAPLRYASGTQNKVLEALSMEVPTVTTTVVADGLRVNESDQPPVCVADGDAEFADEVIRLLRNPQERSAWASAGRAYVEAHFVWSRSAEKLERMCLAALDRDAA